AVLPTDNSPHAEGSPIPFRVGVTGHRPNGLQEARLPLLRGRIRTCLEGAREVVAERRGAGSRLMVVSPLAEGADRLVAEEALALGFHLYAPLPFERSEYERDFVTPASRRTFRRLLERADEVV